MHRARILLAIAFLLLAACDDWDLHGPGRGPDFEGHYALAGTVDGAFGDAVVGTFTITRQGFGSADVSIDWSYLERNVEILNITTDVAAEADLDEDGDIDFEFEGEIFIDGAWYGFRLIHEGRLRGNTINGFWRLITDLPTDDGGSFTARR